MGVDGLLRQLKGAVLETHLRRYSGQTVVVDAFSWLHKACYGCAFELATGKETDAYVRYMLRKVDLLRTCGIGDVILVFDGDRLPLKAMTHSKRSDSKKENRELAFQSMADAKRLHGTARQDEISKAYAHFQKAVSITPDVVNAVMRALRHAHVKFVVAPYEADAQMVWMCKAGLASAVVTEDSDVLVYCMAANVECHVLFKLDDGGMVQALSRKLLHERTATTENAFLKKVHHLTTGDKDATRMFVQFCALAGCDFLESLPNMGIVTALKHIFNFRGAPGAVRVQRLLSKLSSAGTKVPSTFYRQFQLTESIFYHHIVFNATTQTCEFLVDETNAHCHADVFARVKEAMGITTSHACLHSLPVPATASFLGSVPPRELMLAIFNGEKCSRTKQPLTDTSSQSSQPIGTAENVPFSDEDYAVEIDDLSPDDVSFLASVDDEFKPTTVAPRKPSVVVVVDPAAEERKQLQREQQRDATMRSLLNTYGASAAMTQHESPERRSDVTIELITRVSEVPTRQLGRTAKRSIDSMSAPPTTVFSMKELAQRHARDGTSNSKPAISAKPLATHGFFQQVPASKSYSSTTLKTPESVKKRKLQSTNTTSTPARTSPPTQASSSLLKFFQKK